MSNFLTFGIESLLNRHGVDCSCDFDNSQPSYDPVTKTVPSSGVANSVVFKAYFSDFSLKEKLEYNIQNEYRKMTVLSSSVPRKFKNGDIVLSPSGSVRIENVRELTSGTKSLIYICEVK